MPERNRIEAPRRISIIGLGLIGGSLALAFRRAFPEYSIVGYDRREVLMRAIRAGAIDRAARRIAEGCDSDLVVVAVPLKASLLLIPRIVRLLPPGAIVTDVGSVKVPVMKAGLSALPPGRFFVGGHPMAGSEKKGFENADANLFLGARFVLTPPRGTPRRVLDRLKMIVETIGASPVVMTPEAHDRAVAVVSHIPQLAAVGLAALAGRNGKRVTCLAGGGFRDMTRIASSPYQMWREILSANGEEVRPALREYIALLEEVEKTVGMRGGEDTIGRLFTEARKTRRRLSQKR